MVSRIAAALAFITVVAPANANDLNAEQARHFVVGKLFSYTCFEGTRGAGRIYPDGSVAGTIQIRGSGRVHHVRLPPHTLRVEDGSVCAYLRGLPFQPCFNVDRTSERSFRGSIYGLRFAYCDFHRGGHRFEASRKEEHHRSATRNREQLRLRAAIDTP